MSLSKALERRAQFHCDLGLENDLIMVPKLMKENIDQLDFIRIKTPALLKSVETKKTNCSLRENIANHII